MTTKTNYLVNPNATGKQVAYMDLADLFAPFVSGNKAAKTGFLDSSGNDLCNVFAPLVPTGTQYNFNTNLVSLSDSKDLSLVFKPYRYVTVTAANSTTTQKYYYTYTAKDSDNVNYWQIYVFANFLTPSPSDNSGNTVTTTMTDGTLADQITVVFNLNKAITGYSGNQNGPVYYTLVGGGGGGGGGNGTSSAGGGGGGGGLVSNIDVGDANPTYFIPLRGIPYKITIGGGGAGGGAQITGSGGASTRMFYIDNLGGEVEVANAAGGSGGGAGTASAAGAAGTGGSGTGTNNDLIIPGAKGGKGWLSTTTAGANGVSQSLGGRVYPGGPIYYFSGGGAGGRTASSQAYLKGGVGGGGGTNLASGNNGAAYTGPPSIYFKINEGGASGHGYNGLGGGGSGGGLISAGITNVGGVGGNGLCTLCFKIPTLDK